MKTPLTRRRAVLLAAVGSSQVAVQAVGFLAAIVLLRHMAPADYGQFTLAISLLGTANVLTDLGLSSAVMASAGRLAGREPGWQGLLGDADRLHRGIATIAWLACLPLFVWLLHSIDTPPWQIAALLLLVVLTSACNVRALLSLSALRVGGDVAFPQQTELAVNTVRLALFSAAAWIAFDAATALAVVLGVSLLQALVLRRRVQSRWPDLDATATSAHRPALREQVRRQAPNAIYFVLSSQIAVWLVGLFGSAERVAEVGALGRLAALFTIIGSVSAALLLPFFARQHDHAELRAAFVAVNAFFAALLALLGTLALAVPEAMLWILGANYGGLRAELPWVVAAATLAAWGGTLYSLGSARGWVQPVTWTLCGGLVAVALGASLVDVSTVRGAYMLNAALAGIGAAVNFAFVGLQLRRRASVEVRAA